MTDEQVFWRAMRRARYDLAPRLAYADWLDERGEAERAAAIRAYWTGQSAAEVQALVDAVCADPDNNGPRLAFADWLESRVDFARANEVRKVAAWVAQSGRRYDRPE